MRPKSKSKTWNTEDTQAQDVEEPSRKVQAMELPEAEDDNEYEMVPKKSKNKQLTPITNAPPVVVVPIAEAEPLETGEAEIQGELPRASGGLGATDDDWLRSRTNRLLDLVDSTDIAVKTVPEESLQQPLILEQPPAPAEIDTPAEQEDIAENGVEEGDPSDDPDPTVEAIQASGRLFVRNLPYSATEDDLRIHFQSYGTLEEVSTLH